jgi:hypothetical protein
MEWLLLGTRSRGSVRSLRNAAGPVCSVNEAGPQDTGGTGIPNSFGERWLELSDLGKCFFWPVRLSRSLPIRV